MLTALITLLIVALVMFLVWWIIGKFITGTPHQIIGIILGLILLLYALRLFNVAIPGL